MGVRRPVLSISMRPLIGMVQPAASPGSCRAWFIWLISSSCEMWSGVMWRRIALTQPGAHDEYQVSACRHSVLGLQDDHGLQHGERCRVGGRVRPSCFAQHVLHLRELLDDPVGHLQELLRFSDGDARHGGGHVEDGALFQRGHEFRAELHVDGDRNDHQRQGARDHTPFPAQCPRSPPARRRGSGSG